MIENDREIVFNREETKNLSEEERFNLYNREDYGGSEFKDGFLTIYKIIKRTPEQEENFKWFEDFIDTHVKIFENELNSLGYEYNCKSREAYQKDKRTIPGCVHNFREACALIVDYRFKLAALRAQIDVYQEFCFSLSKGNIENISQRAKEVYPRAEAMRIAYSKPFYEFPYQYPDDLWEEVSNRSLD